MINASDLTDMGRTILIVLSKIGLDSDNTCYTKDLLDALVKIDKDNRSKNSWHSALKSLTNKGYTYQDIQEYASENSKVTGCVQVTEKGLKYIEFL